MYAKKISSSGFFEVEGFASRTGPRWVLLFLIKCLFGKFEISKADEKVLGPEFAFFQPIICTMVTLLKFYCSDFLNKDHI